MTTAFLREGGVRCGADLDNTAVQIWICLRTTIMHTNMRQIWSFQHPTCSCFVFESLDIANLPKPLRRHESSLSPG